MREPIQSEQIKERIKAFINDSFLMGSGFGSVSEDDSLLENGIIDSTGILELVTYIEETFGIGVGDEEMVPDNLDSISRLARFIRSKIEV